LLLLLGWENGHGALIVLWQEKGLVEPQALFFNPNKECGKVTSNLIPSEESLAGYSLGTCFI